MNLMAYVGMFAECLVTHVSMFALSISTPHSTARTPISVSAITILILHGHIIRISIPPTSTPPSGYRPMVEDLTAMMSTCRVEVSLHPPRSPGVLDDHGTVGVSNSGNGVVSVGSAAVISNYSLGVFEEIVGNLVSYGHSTAVEVLDNVSFALAD